MMKLYSIDINSLDLSEYEQLSDYRKSKADRCMQEKDRRRSIAAGCLIEQGLSELYGLHEKNMQYVQNVYGKPYFRDCPHIFFNVSHSGDMCIVCFSDYEVGCDVQKMEKADLSVAKRFFTAPERDYILNSKDTDAAFYSVWTLKEAFIKAVGQGLAIPLDSFSVLISDSDVKVEQTIKDCRYQFCHFVKNEYAVAVCTEKRKSSF